MYTYHVFCPCLYQYYVINDVTLYSRCFQRKVYIIRRVLRVISACSTT